MADFNESLSAPSAAGASPIRPVQEQVTNFPNPLIGLGLGLAEVFVKNKAEDQKRQAELAKQSVIGEFTRQQTALSDSIAQGGNMARAGAQARANFSKFAAANPQYAEDLAKVNKTLFDYTDLGEAKDSAQMFKDARKAMINDMVKVGYPVSETTPPDVFEANALAFQASRRADEDMRKLIQKNAEIRSANAEERAAFDFKAKQQSITLLTSIGDAHLNASLANVNALVADVKKTGDIQGGRARLLAMFAPIEQAITAASATHPELGKTYKAQFDELKQFGMDSIDGKIEAGAQENRLKELQSRIMLTTLASPDMKSMYGISKVFNGNIPTNFLDANTTARDAFVRLTNQFGGDVPTIVGRKEMEGPAYEMIKSQVGAVEAGKASNPEATKTALGNVANNILKQVGNAAATGLAPAQLSAAANFIASPEYAKLVSYGKIDKEAAASANKVFSLMYERDVSKAIEAKLDEPFRTLQDGKTITYGSMVNFSWNGSGVSVSTSKTPMNLEDSGYRDVFAANMRSASVALNQLVKAGAHMEGHTDYQKYWEENKHNILPGYFPDPARLKPGQVVDGYKYIGGNVRDKSNWVKEKAK